MPRHRSQESWHFLSTCKDEEAGRDFEVAQDWASHPRLLLRIMRGEKGGGLKFPGLSPPPDRYTEISREAVQVLFSFKSSPDCPNVLSGLVNTELFLIEEEKEAQASLQSGQPKVTLLLCLQLPTKSLFQRR